MKIALDAMGGDYAPKETVKGAVEAVREIPQLTVVLVGNQDKIENELKKYKYNENKIEIVHTDEEILMKESIPPAMAVRKKKDASMNIALRLVKDGECAGAVSAGNTGALMTSSQLTLKRIKGVLRPAITTVFPNKNGNMVMMDVGANADCKAEYINQFAVMGSEFSKIILEKDNPKVGLINIGEEPGKGNELVKEAYELLKDNKKINFVGNVETREMFGAVDVDVVVADGFTGNIVLKTAEGVAKFMTDILKENIKISFIRKIGALLLKPVFTKLKDKLDASAYGGAIFLGLNGISIKAHGNSDAKAIKNALKVAHKFAETDFVEKLKQVVQEEA
jgi:glycerol-3-phosphate acyltransferase PlsX